MSHIVFSKCNGCGNDFIFLDHRNGQAAPEKPWIEWACHRQVGIGADGVVVLENACDADLRMRIFNRDGSEAEMCGNAARCIIPFLESLGETTRKYHIESLGARFTVERSGKLVTLGLPAPSNLRLQQNVANSKGNETLHFIDTGVPHAVVFVKSLDDPHFVQWARTLRYHPISGPNGANINAAQIEAQKIRYRTYERGVESETLACGTGATAVAVLAHLVHGIASPIHITTSLGDTITISFERTQNGIDHIEQTGPATHVFSGTLK